MAATLDPAFVEREYNARALVPEHPAFFARWERDSAFVRSTLPCTLDLAYGPDPRHRVDWFPAAGTARGTLVFIHGGYWRSLDKSMFSWLAASYVPEGLDVAMLEYRLCPAVRIDEIVEDVVAGVNWVMGHKATGRAVVAGHSAGGHLVGALFATPRDRLAFDPARIAGGVSLSGLFDFEPLRIHSFNADFHLDEAAVARLNLHDKATTIKAPLVVAAGGDESSEFQRQSRLIGEKWAPQVKALQLLPGYNHFSIVDAFAERGQPLHQAVLGFLRANPADLTPADFNALEGPLRLEVGAGSSVATLDLAVEAIETLPSHRLRAAPFSLVLRGPRTPLLPQATYSVRHPGLGPVELFLVPIGQDASGSRYEVVFN